MAKDKFTLMDFVKKQSLANITGVFGEECLNEDGTVMSLADQAVNLVKYLCSDTSFTVGVEPEADVLRKENVVLMLLLLSEEVDVSEFDPHNFGIGYSELRYFSIDSKGNPLFESNNVHDWEKGEDAYKVFAWEELTDTKNQRLKTF